MSNKTVNLIAYLEKNLAISNSKKENTSMPMRVWLWYCAGIDVHIFSTGA